MVKSINAFQGDPRREQAAIRYDAERNIRISNRAFDKFLNASSARFADVGMAGVQGQLEIRKPLQNFNKISRLKKGTASGKHVFEANTKPRSCARFMIAARLSFA